MFNQRFMARVVAPNLTEVRVVYSDLDFVRMLRHGVRPNGRSATPATVDRENLEGFGRYLSLAICTECHGTDLRGSGGFLTTPTLAVSMAYTAEQFREFLRTGIALGGRELEMMSAIARERYAGFTDHEIDALHAYLRTLAATAPEGES